MMINIKKVDSYLFVGEKKKKKKRYLIGFLNNYVPDYVPSELPLYDRDRLMM